MPHLEARFKYVNRGFGDWIRIQKSQRIPKRTLRGAW